MALVELIRGCQPLTSSSLCYWKLATEDDELLDACEEADDDTTYELDGEVEITLYELELVAAPNELLDLMGDVVALLEEDTTVDDKTAAAPVKVRKMRLLEPQKTMSC